MGDVSRRPATARLGLTLGAVRDGNLQQSFRVRCCLLSHYEGSLWARSRLLRCSMGQRIGALWLSLSAHSCRSYVAQRTAGASPNCSFIRVQRTTALQTMDCVTFVSADPTRRLRVRTELHSRRPFPIARGFTQSFPRNVTMPFTRGSARGGSALALYTPRSRLVRFAACGLRARS